MIHVLFKFAKNPYGGHEVDVTSNSGFWSDLSPFLLPALKYGSLNFENLWQFSKVYASYWDETNHCPLPAWEDWRLQGFSSQKAIRYPMGKGVKPICSWWEGEKLSYVEARKAVYAPIYAELVGKTEGYGLLRCLYDSLSVDGEPLVLRDYDAYDHVAMGRSLRDVINDPDRKCGHGFVLAMMLTGELGECVL